MKYLMFFVLSLSASVFSGELVYCHNKDLKNHEFSVENLSIKFKELELNNFVSYKQQLAGRAFVSIFVRNVSDDKFVKFEPKDIVFVGGDGVQQYAIFELSLDNVIQPVSFSIAPKAIVNVEYALSDELVYPVNIYVKEKQVALLSK